MNRLKQFILVALMIPAFSQAALNLPEPEVLLKEATQGRSALLDTIVQLEFNIPEMRDPTTFDKYFSLLDHLQDLATKSGLEEYYPNAVGKLGVNMSANGMRWLDLTTAEAAKVSYYIKWMDADGLARFLGLAEYQVSAVKEVQLLKTMSENIEQILPQIDQTASNLPYVQLGFRRLISDAAVAILKTETLTEEGVSFWLKKIKVASSFSEYLDYLNQGIYALDKQNKAASHLYLARLSLLGGQIASLSEVAPNWLTNGIGDSTSEVILRMVRFEETFRPSEFTAALATYKARHLQGLAQQWMAQEKLPSQDYVTHYLNLSRELLTALQKSGLRKEANDLQKWLAKAAAPVMAQKLNIEGHYELRNEVGDVWYLTIAVAKENSLIAALSSQSQVVFKTFYNVSYNLKKDGFVASEREPDLDEDQNPPIEFQINDDKIDLYDPFVRTQYKNLKGKKIQEFTDLWKSALSNAPSAEGTYEGRLFLPSGNEMKVRVIISTFNGYTIGRVDGDNVTIDLNIGSEGEDGVILLTSGRNVGGSWFQLRANVVEDGLKAYVIVGGKGQGTACTLLKKVR